jgi:hypothetical protein
MNHPQERWAYFKGHRPAEATAVNRGFTHALSPCVLKAPFICERWLRFFTSKCCHGLAEPRRVKVLALRRVYDEKVHAHARSHVANIS